MVERYFVLALWVAFYLDHQLSSAIAVFLNTKDLDDL